MVERMVERMAGRKASRSVDRKVCWKAARTELSSVEWKEDLKVDPMGL